MALNHVFSHIAFAHSSRQDKAFLQQSLIVPNKLNCVELVTLPASTQWRAAAALADGQPGWPSSYATSAAASTVRDLWWLTSKLKFQCMYQVNWLTIAAGRATRSIRNSGGGLRVGALWVRYEFHWVRQRLILHEKQLAPGAWKRPFKVR